MLRYYIRANGDGKARRWRKGTTGAGVQGAHTCVHAGECVALAWELDTEHVLDRVYRVTDLRAHHNASPSPYPPPTRPSSEAPRPRLTARASHRPLCLRLNATPSHARTHVYAYIYTYIRSSTMLSWQTMRDLARSPFFATIVRAVLITCDAQYGRDKFSP